jgi:branched-chain amino acid transport system substrate-binding protein
MSFGKAIRVCLVAGSLAAVTACGSSSNSSSSSSSAGGGGGGGGGSTVDIYSSLPLQGATSAQTGPTVNGMKLALSQAGGKAGQFKVNYTSLDDSTAAKGNYDLGQCAANGRKAATDTKAVAYLGEFNSGCTEVSLPILNQAGLPMISPANTYVGLTTNQPKSMVLPGEPQKYYPTGTRTYLRIVPRDSIQGAADLLAMKQAGCTKVAVANDKTPYGAGIAQVITLLKGSYGVSVASNMGIDPTAPNYRSYAATIKGQGADCFFFGGVTANGGVQIAKDVHAAIPKAKIFGPDGVCSAAWTNAKMGGVPAAIDPLMQCTQAALNLTSYPGGKSFLAAYKAKYGVSHPDPYAIYGYEDMKLALDTIKSLGAKGNSKSAVLKALFAIKARPSVLGTYGFDSDGDTTLKSYGLYKVGSDGNLAFFKALTPKVTS